MVLQQVGADGNTEIDAKVAKAKAYADIEAANNGGFTDKLSEKMNRAKESRTGAILLNNPIVRAVTYGSTYKVRS